VISQFLSFEPLDHRWFIRFDIAICLCFATIIFAVSHSQKKVQLSDQDAALWVL
jgi:hypothetical protein